LKVGPYTEKKKNLLSGLARYKIEEMRLKKTAEIVRLSVEKYIKQGGICIHLDIQLNLHKLKFFSNA